MRICRSHRFSRKHRYQKNNWFPDRRPAQVLAHIWWGGTEAGGFPNGWWDHDGFGFFSIKPGRGLDNDAAILEGNDPGLPIEVVQLAAPFSSPYRV